MQTFQKGSGENKLSFPLDRRQIRGLQECNLASPRVGKNHGVPMPAALCSEEAIEEALSEVAQVRELVKAGTFPWAFMHKYYPADWGDFPDEIPDLLAAEGLTFDDPDGLANVVHMDLPIDLPAAMQRWLINIGARPKAANGKFFDFLEIVVEPLNRMSRLVDAALEKAFEVKWYFGLPRPEELHEDGAALTHYPEGCPTHPTFPAGHGAAAFAPVEYLCAQWVDKDGQELSGDVKKALFDSAYVWAMARTFAGVHFAVDNLTFAVRRSEV